MQSTLCALALCSLVAVLLAGEIPDLIDSDSTAVSADKRGLRTFAFAKRYPMAGFAKRDNSELPTDANNNDAFGDEPEEQKRGWNRFAFAKRSMRNFAFAKRAMRPFAFAKKSMRNFAFAKRSPYSSFA